MSTVNAGQTYIQEYIKNAMYERIIYTKYMELFMLDEHGMLSKAKSHVMINKIAFDVSKNAYLIMNKVSSYKDQSHDLDFFVTYSFNKQKIVMLHRNNNDKKLNSFQYAEEME